MARAGHRLVLLALAGGCAFLGPKSCAKGLEPALRGRSHSVARASGAGERQEGEPWASYCLAALLCGSALFGAVPARAESKRLVGEIPASGFIFKDTINVEAFDDPKVSGVTLYISDFSRSMADRVSKGDFFSDPGAAGLTCAKSGPVKIAADVKPNKEGEDIFSEARSLLFKTLRVKRIYDPEAKNILYVVFTERLNNQDDSNKSRFKSQVCAVHVDGVMDK
ncbi:unnamed protein product [Effrenium voratum]|nr:unnamed protein product [Effrenium voratum]|eukprot:CAMPEP_0181473522 /NCGR_PEP_ID=MMETSP1110-20121109/40166_1 /TAXON_ID=174948 /ORGANISM="Symbiodinium sp., Strain CCMP421" /LENGTH=222 /DNA_ID=CAMNT_0023598639 /DNA_START=25 /DNA_END=693 /DNA_ORIENTATION=+